MFFKPLKLFILLLAIFYNCSSAWSDSNQLSDAEILGIYTQVNSFDIETALLGMSKGCSHEIKNLAKHIATDHMGVRKAVLELADANGIQYILPPSRVNAQMDHNMVLDKLVKLKCPKFNIAFLEHDIQFHIAAIDAVRNILLPNTKNKSLRKHFKSVLPAFERHLKMTKSARDRLLKSR